MRACTGCGVDYPEDKYKLRASTGPQAGTRHRQCNRCLYLKYTKPGAVQKTAMVQAYKVAKGCTDCGYAAHPAALQFDHLPGAEKSFNVMEKVGCYSMELIWAEIDKCEVVCANCHAVRTVERREAVSA